MEIVEYLIPTRVRVSPLIKYDRKRLMKDMECVLMLHASVHFANSVCMSAGYR
jgi:hypothetical protein